MRAVTVKAVYCAQIIFTLCSTVEVSAQTLNQNYYGSLYQLIMNSPQPLAAPTNNTVNNPISPMPLLPVVAPQMPILSPPIATPPLPLPPTGPTPVTDGPTLATDGPTLATDDSPFVPSEPTPVIPEVIPDGWTPPTPVIPEPPAPPETPQQECEDMADATFATCQQDAYQERARLLPDLTPTETDFRNAQLTNALSLCYNDRNNQQLMCACLANQAMPGCNIDEAIVQICITTAYANYENCKRLAVTAPAAQLCETSKDEEISSCIGS
jgi:hypothetical protein